MILSLEATICTTVHSNEAKKLPYAMTAAVVKSATYLEGSVAELSLASWTPSAVAIASMVG